MNVRATLSVPASIVVAARKIADALDDYHRGMFRGSFANNAVRTSSSPVMYVSSGVLPTDSWMLGSKADMLAALIDTAVTTAEIEQFANFLDVQIDRDPFICAEDLDAERKDAVSASPYAAGNYAAGALSTFRGYTWVSGENTNQFAPGVRSWRVHWSTTGNAPDAPVDTTGLASNWMRGNWGVRFVMPGGPRDATTNFDISAIAAQLQTLKTARWAMVSLAEPSWANRFSVVSPELQAINANMSASVDLLGTALTSLKAQGYNTLVYFASQGPDVDFRNPEDLERFQQNNPVAYALYREIESDWDAHVLASGNTANEEVASTLVEPFAVSYGTQIDGWWFDHGQEGDYALYRAAAKAGNADALIGWNEVHETVSIGEGRSLWAPAKSFETEEYTAGHLTPGRVIPPWDDRNELVIDLTISKLLAQDESTVWQLFTPAQNDYRSGDDVFPLEKMIRWTRSIVAAGGAVTWAIALEFPEFQISSLRADVLARIQQLDTAMQADLPALR